VCVTALPTPTSRCPPAAAAEADEDAPGSPYSGI